MLVAKEGVQRFFPGLFVEKWNLAQKADSIPSESMSRKLLFLAVIGLLCIAGET